MSGYQGSLKSTVRVTVYPNNGDGTFGGAVKFDGTGARSPNPAIINCHVQRTLGGGASFAVNFKRAGFEGPLDYIPVESWVDISFAEGGKSWHVLRGLVDEVRRDDSVAGGGATSITYTMVGRDFQKIYEDTPAMFNPYLGDYDNSDEVLRALQKFTGTPSEICQTVLVTLLASLGQRGRGLWQMPAAMPGCQPLFVSSAAFNADRFDLYDIPRAVPSANLFLGGGPLWSLAQQFSDPMFTELFTELLPSPTALATAQGVDVHGEEGLAEGDAQMVVVLRDKPFMAVDPLIGRGPLQSDSPYFGIPQFKISRQLCTQINIGRSAYERTNSFVLSPPPSAGQPDNFITYKLPLWDRRDQLAHGFRQMTVSQSYELFDQGGSKGSRTVDESTTALKRLCRDHYCVNADFLSGSVMMARGAPWLKVGCRLQVVDGTTAVRPLNAYIEGYSHEYSLATGTRTSISITRGFFGTEAEMLTRLKNVSSRYVQPFVQLGLPKGATK